MGPLSARKEAGINQHQDKHFCKKQEELKIAQQKERRKGYLLGG